MPSRLRTSLNGIGFSAQYERGMVLKVHSTSAPFLTWPRGSAGQDVPTPKCSWIAISYKDNQPPVVLGFLGKKSFLKTTGTPGDWTISTPSEYEGWIRFGLPWGTQGFATTTAGSLGQLAKAISDSESQWTTWDPLLEKTFVTADEDAVIASWMFDKPGARVPIAAAMASLGGYPLKLFSNSHTTDFRVDNIPVQLSDEKVIRIRFPVRRIPSGRSLAFDAPFDDGPGTVSTFDIPSVVDLAVSSMYASRDASVKQLVEDTLSDFLGQSIYAREPFTDQLLPYDAEGTNMDLSAAHAMLMQTSLSTHSSSAEQNSLLTSINWRRDWFTWLPWTDKADSRRRTAALAALAGSMSPEPEKRLAAGMFQAGLSAEMGLQIWQKRRQITDQIKPVLEPFPELREGLFRLQNKQPTLVESYVATVLGPIRVYGNLPMRLLSRGKEILLQWTSLEPKPTLIRIETAFPVSLSPVTNLSKFRVDQTLGTMEVSFTPETTGVCEARLTIPDWATAPPKFVRIPPYSEPVRASNPN